MRPYYFAALLMILGAMATYFLWRQYHPPSPQGPPEPPPPTDKRPPPATRATSATAAIESLDSETCLRRLLSGQVKVEFGKKIPELLLLLKRKDFPRIIRVVAECKDFRVYTRATYYLKDDRLYPDSSQLRARLERPDATRQEWVLIPDLLICRGEKEGLRLWVRRLRNDQKALEQARGDEAKEKKLRLSIRGGLDHLERVTVGAVRFRSVDEAEKWLRNDLDKYEFDMSQKPYETAPPLRRARTHPTTTAAFEPLDSETCLRRLLSGQVKVEFGKHVPELLALRKRNDYRRITRVMLESRDRRLITRAGAYLKDTRFHRDSSNLWRLLKQKDLSTGDSALLVDVLICRGEEEALWEAIRRLRRKEQDLKECRDEEKKKRIARSIRAGVGLNYLEIVLPMPLKTVDQAEQWLKANLHAYELDMSHAPNTSGPPSLVRVRKRKVQTAPASRPAGHRPLTGKD